MPVKVIYAHHAIVPGSSGNAGQEARSGSLSAMHGAQDCAHMHGHHQPTWRDHESWLGAQSMSVSAN